MAWATGLARAGALHRIAETYGVTPYQVALAWLLHKGEHILPIPGASKVSSIRDSLEAADIHLATQELQSLDTIQGLTH